MKFLARMYRAFALLVQLPILLGVYLDRETGREYGLGFFRKLGLFLRMQRNTRRVPSASHVLEHLSMATTLLRMPNSVPGCVVECGTYKGGSATNLSLICRITGRQLHVFDSFEGLPEPSERDRSHVLIDQRTIHTYEKGSWAGSLDEVRGNITRNGAIDVVTFHRGYFDQSLPGFHEPCVLVFADVDLVDSLEPCVKHLWPLLQTGGHFYTHEAPHLEISAFFFDAPWWRANLGEPAPGLIGAGTGLGLFAGPGSFHSDIGYAVKDARRLELVVDHQRGLER